MSAVAANPATGTAAEAPTRSKGRRHLEAVDIIRVVMVAGVIAVHVVGYTAASTDVLAGAVTDILHLNREVFFVLTAFVLTYNYGARQGWSVRRFWARRYLFVTVPYLVWTAIYFVADGSERAPWLRAVHRLTTDVLQGTARYHLYFLLVTMQIYAVFPLLLWLLRATRRHHGALLAAAVGFQLALTLVLHYRLPRPPVVAVWLRDPDPFLVSYIVYVVGGGIAGMHFDEITAWVRTHNRQVAAFVAEGFALAIAAYCVDHYVVHLNPAQAGEVFQPMVVFTSAGAISGLYALGLRWADRGPARRFQRPVSIAADASFGIFLAHPLLIQVMLTMGLPVVRRATSGQIPNWVVLPVDLLVIVPFIFVVTCVAVRAVRYTPASLALTGRPQLQRPAKGPGSGVPA